MDYYKRIAALRALCRRIQSNDRPLPIRATGRRVVGHALTAGLVVEVSIQLEQHDVRALVTTEAGYELARAVTGEEVQAALELPALLGMVG